MSYDSNGNLLAYNNFALSYDMENHLVGAQSGSATTNYVYDPEGHRMLSFSGSSSGTVYF